MKLRHNIVVEGDLALARMELAALFSNGVHDILGIASVVRKFPELARLHGLSRLESFVRPEGVQAFHAQGSLIHLPDLIRRPSFIQRVYCITADTTDTRAWIAELRERMGPLIAYHRGDGRLVIQGIPHCALFELAGVIARRSSGVQDTQQNLDALLASLMNAGEASPVRRGEGSQRYEGEQLARVALAARSTTNHLSHDLHYFKAKFFPRLARSMLNVCALRLGDSAHRVFDPFVGSGTTLLEAATLGLRSVGLDIDPLSVLISEVKANIGSLASESLEEEAARSVKTLESLLGLRSPPEVERPIKFPAWLLKNRRMTPEIAMDLSREISAVQAAVSASGPHVRPVFRVLMSDAISRRIRMRFLGTGVGRFSLTFSKATAPELFVRSLQRYTRAVATCEWLRRTIHLEMADSQVIEGDARRLSDGLGAFDMVVTSPPYLPASSGRESYARARAPSLIALGMREHDQVDTLADDAIGSMNGADVELDDLTADEQRLVEWLRRDSLRAVKSEPTARYFVDMRRAFVEMRRALRPGGVGVVVSGKQSTFYRFSTREALYVARSAEWLADEAERAGLVVEALHDVQLQKASANARPRSLDDYYETLIMFRNPS